MQSFIEIAINHSQDLLTIQEFVSATNYPIDQLYVDKFWHSLGSDNEELIYVDDGLIQWLGYESADPHSRKLSFEKLLSRSGESIEKLTNEEYSKFVLDHTNNPPAFEGKGSNKITHLLITPDCLRWVMMQVNTKKGEQIRRYYTELEKLFRLYSNYQIFLVVEQSKAAIIALERSLENALNTHGITITRG